MAYGIHVGGFYGQILRRSPFEMYALYFFVFAETPTQRVVIPVSQLGGEMFATNRFTNVGGGEKNIIRTEYERFHVSK